MKMILFRRCNLTSNCGRKVALLIMFIQYVNIDRIWVSNVANEQV